MKYIGAHVSTQGGVFNAPLRAKQLNAQAFACFTKNQRRWMSPSYSKEEVVKFKHNLKTSGILPSYILAHSGYLINLGSPNKQSRNRSIAALIDEVNRCYQLGITFLNFHPGSHLGQISEMECMDYIVGAINDVMSATNKVILVIENTCGQGGNVGYRFEHIAYLISGVTDKSRIGVCIDTCHLFAAGYDFRTVKTYNKTWSLFDEVIGFKYLKGMHLNDSKNDLGSKLDRHDSIGKGKIGLKPFKFLMQDPRFNDMPLILETIDPLLWQEEIRLLYTQSILRSDN